MKKYTFTLKNNPSTFYTPSYKSTDYSKILDDLINADIAEKNPWLYSSGNDDAIYTPSSKIKITLNNNTYTSNNLLGEIHAILNKKDEYDSYINYLNNFNIFDLGKMYKKKTLYKLGSGIKFMILEDGILINGKMIFFDDLNDNLFFCNLGENMKKTIATIYIDGLKITIKK